MRGSRSKSGVVLSWADDVEEEEEALVLSWADEVEQEDAAAPQAQAEQKRKENPFGSARPREVVLQEKGIDWRKLDHQLQEPSHLWRERESQDERLLRESSLAPVASVLDMIQPNPRSGRLGEATVLLLTPEERIPLTFDPPLRYPPKIIVGRMLETAKAKSLNRWAEGRRTSGIKSHLASGKENRCHEPQGRELEDLKSLNSNCRIHFYYDQPVVDVQRQFAPFGNSTNKAKPKKTKDVNARNRVPGSSVNPLVTKTGQRRWNNQSSGSNESGFRGLNDSTAIRSRAEDTCGCKKGRGRENDSACTKIDGAHVGSNHMKRNKLSSTNHEYHQMKR